MNKQELIKEFEEIGIHGLNMFGTVVKGIPTETAIDLIKQLDEPQPVKVPQCVADWIEVCKEHLTTSLYTAMNPNFMKENNQSFDLILWIKKTSNQDLFVRAWLDGYEVEEEKKFFVKIKCLSEEYKYLNYFKSCREWLFSEKEETKEYRIAHTRKELEEAGFGEVFNSPLFEVLEVE